MTHAEALDILNRFAGWKPGQKCAGEIDVYDGPDGPWAECSSCRHVWSIAESPNDHDIPQTDYFAPTPAAREALRLLKDEFVRRTGNSVVITSYADEHDQPRHRVWNMRSCPIEHHAIAFALAEALKERGNDVLCA